MSHISPLILRPSTLGAIAVAGSAAFYISLKYKTILGAPVQRTSVSGSSQGSAEAQARSYEVKAGREGGGV